MADAVRGDMPDYYVDQIYIDFAERNSFLYAEFRRRGLQPIPGVSPGILRQGLSDEDYVEAIMASLDHAPTERDLQAYGYMLRGTKHPYDGMRLVEIFEKTTNWAIRYDFLHALTDSNAIGIERWIRKVLADNSYGEFQRMLASMVSFMDSAREYLPILREHFSECPFGACQTFGAVGGQDEYDMLLQHRNNAFDIPLKDQKEYFKLVEKCILKIEKRLAREAAKRQRKQK